MNIGAFAGGAAKGYETGEGIQQSRKKLDLAQTASDREGERLKLSQNADAREQRDSDFKNDQQTRQQAYQKDLSDWMQQNSPGSTPASTGMMSGPTDANDARAAMPAAQPAAAIPVDQAAIPSSVDAAPGMAPPNAPADLPAAAPQQTAFNIPGKQGMDLNDPSAQPFLMRATAASYMLQAKHGLVPPDKIAEGQKALAAMEKDGSANAFRRFMQGDASALDELAKKNGVESYKVGYDKGPDGLPHQTLFMTKDGQVTKMPLTTAAAVFGVTDLASVADKQDDNTTKGNLSAANARYYDAHGVALKEDSESKRKIADAKVAKAGAVDDSYDPAYVETAMKKTPFTLNMPGAMQLPGQKPPIDTWAQQEAERMANDSYSKGGDPTESVSVARKLVQKVNADATSATDAKGAPLKFKTSNDYDQWRQKRLDQMESATKKAAPAPAPASAIPVASSPSMKVASQTQALRDGGRRDILSEELGDEQGKLAKQTDATEIARTKANIAALQRELTNLPLARRK